MNNPAHVSWAMRTQRTGDGVRGFLGGRAQEIFDRGEGADKARTMRRAQRAKHVGHLLIGTTVEKRDGFAPARAESEKLVACVGDGTLSSDETAPHELAQNAAEIAAVQIEVAGDDFCGWILQKRKLLQNAAFGKGERAIEIAFAEDADLPSVEAIEAPDSGDFGLQRRRRCGVSGGFHGKNSTYNS